MTGHSAPCKVASLTDSQIAQVKAIAETTVTPFIIFNGEKIREQYRKLKAALPTVRLYYAMKPCPNPDVVEILLSEGASFDVATVGEIELALGKGVSASDMIHTHPIKRDCDIRGALGHGVKVFVVDNPVEILKFIPYKDDVKLMLRVSFRSPNAKVDLSKKFGCAPDQVFQHLELAREHGINIFGFCFHVGSQTSNPQQYVIAIERCNELIRSARAAGYNLEVLDIGGGFPIDYGLEAIPCISDFTKPINEALAKLPSDVSLYAEPGRFICGPSMTAVSSVMGKAIRDGKTCLYLDDGLYGSYSGQIFDHCIYAKAFIGGNNESEETILYGPTCDSIDVIAETINIPKLEVGDLVVGLNMAAYTWATSTDFNYWPRAKIVHAHFD
ncbi:hypothetical protein RCL1_001752 [Eukaryota sp. TZLM3-RCL]